MKKWTLIPKLTLAFSALCAGFLSSAQDKRISHIPDVSALVVKLNLEKLNSSPAFKAIADSGILASIRDDLKQIPWTENGALPDPVVVYAPVQSQGYAMLVNTDKRPQELAEMMTAQFGDGKTAEYKQYAIGDTVTVKRSFLDHKKRQQSETEARIVYLTSSIAAFGRAKSPVSYSFFANERVPADELASLQAPGPAVVAAGIMRNFPVPASDDPTGLSALVKTGEFTVSEQESGEVSFTLEFDCKGEKEAALAARRLKSFVRIALVSLFAADKDLLRELNGTYKTACEGNKAGIELGLPKTAVEKILAFYGITPEKDVPMAAPAVKQEDAQK